MGSKLDALLKTHEEIPKIIERAERMPECFGLSCAFRGPSQGEARGGKKYARCEELISVDCVTAPAANPVGLFSAKEAGSPALRLIAARERRLVRTVELDKKKRELRNRKRRPVARQ